MIKNNLAPGYISDRDLEAACAKAGVIECVRINDNSGTYVYLAGPDDFYGSYSVGNSTQLFGVWAYYSQDVAAFCKRSNPKAVVRCDSHGKLLDFAEQMKQW